jgi:hypothetical protein
MSDILNGYTTNLLFLAFGGFGLWRGWRDLGRARLSTTWPHAVGEIVGSELRVEDYHDDGEPMRRAAITYRYEIGGTMYQGARVFFGDGIALRFAGPGRQRLAAYHAGRLLRVAYDPTNPASAVLEPGASAAAYVACLVPAAIALWGIVGLVAGA